METCCCYSYRTGVTPCQCGCHTKNLYQPPTGSTWDLGEKCCSGCYVTCQTEVMKDCPSGCHTKVTSTFEETARRVLDKNKDVMERLKKHDEGETIDTSNIENALKEKEEMVEIEFESGEQASIGVKSEFPATWFDHFRVTYFPKLLTGPFPIKYKIEKLRWSAEVGAVYPKLPLVFPKAKEKIVFHSSIQDPFGTMRPEEEFYD